MKIKHTLFPSKPPTPVSRFQLRLEASPGGVWCCVNGIYGSDWNKQAVVWGAANTSDTWTDYHYWTGILRWGQTAHTQALAAMIKTQLSLRPKFYNLAGHSNGCDLILSAILSDPTIMGIKDLHLFAAADYRDCGEGFWKNAINTILTRGQVQRVFIYTSTGDMVLGGTIFLPTWWGRTLGRYGPTDMAFNCDQCSWADLVRMGAGAIHVGTSIQQVTDNTRNHGDWMYLSDGTTLNTATMVAITAISGDLNVAA